MEYSGIKFNKEEEAVKPIETNPFMQAMLKRAKQEVRRWEDECNRREPITNAGWHLQKARQELKDILSELRQEGYKV